MLDNYWRISIKDYDCNWNHFYFDGFNSVMKIKQTATKLLHKEHGIDVIISIFDHTYYDEAFDENKAYYKPAFNRSYKRACNGDLIESKWVEVL